MASLAELRERRELLLARSAVQRLEIARDMQALRGVASRAGGLGRAARIVRGVALGLALFRLARAWRRR